ncbi:MAG: hypothetical protein ACRDF0_08320 [Candidatus Limnocylindria bacterium]
MRSVLAAEFGDLAPLLRRVRPTVAAAPAGWAALAGLGAWTLVSGAVSALLLYPMAMTDWAGPAPFQVAQFAGPAAGVAVAVASGGRSGALVLGAYIAVLVARGWLGLVVQACPDAGLPCRDALSVAIAQLPLVVGALTGVALAGLVARAPRGRNGLLEAAGAFGLVPAAIFFALSPWTRELAEDPLPLAAAVMATAVVLLRRSARPLRDALVLAAVLIASWVPFGTSQLAQALIQLPDPRAPLFASLRVIEALAIVGTVAVLRRARHHPMS